MDYSYYPDKKIASKLIIVGESKLDKPTEEYLANLRKMFGLPVYYENI